MDPPGFLDCKLNIKFYTVSLGTRLSTVTNFLKVLPLGFSGRNIFLIRLYVEGLTLLSFYSHL